MTRTDRVGGAQRLRLWVAGFVLLSALSALWSLATPIYAAPDETAHVAKAVAVVRGELLGEQREGAFHLVTSLPDGYRFPASIMCFAFYSDIPAECGVRVGDADGTDWFDNWVARYDPLYYVLVGWPSLIWDGSAGIYAMRLVSALVFSAILALALPLAMTGRSRWMATGLAFVVTPMVTFFGGTVSPQSTEIAGGVVVWLGLLRLLEYYQDSGAERPVRWIWAATLIGSVFLLHSRSLGPLWWVVIAAFCVIAIGWRSVLSVLRDRDAWGWIAGIVVAGIASVAWTLAAGVFGGQVEAGGSVLTPAVLEGVLLMIGLTPAFIEQSVGFFGWLDTPLPPVGMWGFFVAAAVLLFFALAATARRGRIVSAAALALVLVLPIIVQSATIEKTGLIWQGRYGLVFSLGAMLIAAWALSVHGDRRIDFLSVRAAGAIVIILAAVHLLGFVTTLKRYVVGLDATMGEFLSSPQWQPPGGWMVLSVACVLVLAAIAWAVIVLARSAAAAADARERARVD